MNPDRRIQLAAQFVKGELTQEEAYEMLAMVETAAGCYAVASLCTADVVERLLLKYEDHPLFEQLADDAADQVALEAEGTSLDFEYDRAIELVEEAAVERGLKLIEKESADADQR